MVDQQLRHNDCGISAVKTVCNLLEVDINREVIKDRIALTQQGATMGSLNNFFTQHGFSTNYKLLDFNAIDENANLKDWFPAIMPIKKTGGLHYIVIQGMQGKRFMVLDPAESKPYKLTVQQLKKRAYFSSSLLEYADLDSKIRAVINADLKERNIELPYPYLSKQQTVEIFNKLSYVSYISENYGFKDKEMENEFLKDVLFNQDLNGIHVVFFCSMGALVSR